MGKKKNKKNTSAQKFDNVSLSTEIVNLQPSVSDFEPINNFSSQISEVSVNGNVNFDIVYENYNQISGRYKGREYYINSLCQICKDDPKERVVCQKCQLVMYCSQEHRRLHWPIHADLCEAIGEVCKERNVDHIMTGALNLPPDTYRLFRFQNMMECEIKVQRPLEKWEKEIFLFPYVCGKCNEFDINRLVVCSHCLHVGFCKGHEMKTHKDSCKHVLRFKNIIKDQAKSGIVSPAIPNCIISPVLPKLLDMESVFKGIRNINEFEYLELTEIITYPLTAMNTLLTDKDKLSRTRNLTLHVVGAEADFEINKLEKWEFYILHLIPTLQILNIEFIGPELDITSDLLNHKVCRQCALAKKTVNFKFHNKLYHIFCDKKYSSKPDLICVFNPGLYRTTGFDGKDTWRPSITSMFAHHCPVLVTAYTRKEILLDVKTVKSNVNVGIVVEPVQNPFSSLKPNLNFVSDEETPVIFKNNFVCVMSIN